MKESLSVEVRDNGEPLVDLSTYGFALDPIYYQRGFSSTPKMYLRLAVAGKLQDVQCGLPQGFRLKIWDGWRARKIQNAIYAHFLEALRLKHPDWSEERLRHETALFAAPAARPEAVPQHATGGAVDLTIVDAAGKELEMGTGFDHLGPEAASRYFEENAINAVVRDNRRLLREAMLKADFADYHGEWWHFSYGGRYWAESLGRPLAFYGEVMEWQD
jgi:zinc D-Ala-D-Ala dipeptidase